jgi:hypothetical protein
VFAAMSAGLLIQAFNIELPQLHVFTTLKLGKSQAGQDVNDSMISDSQINYMATGEMQKTQVNGSTTAINGSVNNKNQGERLLIPKPTVLLTPLQKASPGIYPDDDCLFDPSLPKCSPIEGKCPAGFLMNEDEQCFPDKPCPAGFIKPDEDETGACYPIGPTTPLMTNGTNISSSDGS